MNYYAIILASGTGSRSGLDIPKQFYKINDKTVLEYSVSAFENHPLINYIIVVSNPDFIDLTKNIISKNKYKKVIKIIEGGKTRQESSFNGVNSVNEMNAKVLIHDAARPFVTEKIISDCINALKKFHAVNTAIDSSDTIIEVDENNIIKSVPDRNRLKRCQTPQCFDIEFIKKAHALAKENEYKATDDCGLILKYNICPIYTVEGSTENVKITYPEDIELFKKYISR